MWRVRCQKRAISWGHLETRLAGRPPKRPHKCLNAKFGGGLASPQNAKYGLGSMPRRREMPLIAARIGIHVV